MKIKEVAELSGVSTRTLHHYDKIGLLSPKKATESGYRIYTDQDVSTLQQILFFRALDFPLKKIKEIMSSSNYNQLEALEIQQRLLLDKRKKLNVMLETIEKTIQSEKGDYHMSNEAKFNGFDFSQNPYEQEAREKWGGDKKVDEATQNITNSTEKMQDDMNQIYRDLAEIRHLDPSSDQAQAEIKKWYDFLNKHITTYSLQAFQGLGMMYVQDQRFTKNIDQFGKGLAQFMSDAMVEFSKR
ncbi:transcriptional regulator [Gracilibacillus boraciitolerans JCM 21714]|uniref:Transcriptional regulator n=1 Tax=Gracilibacillus boraciitolerans JCM 21714 TaxID=1298598 RepID=W4VMD8_9BACI|nr:MerR family transcriptional regulator [Gracilibacillus boraciitolerans]GAE93968.1 transcriptional regulator [Gracilibacillus boraciitolerans JCM 21714]